MKSLGTMVLGVTVAVGAMLASPLRAEPTKVGSTKAAKEELTKRDVPALKGAAVKAVGPMTFQAGTTYVLMVTDETTKVTSGRYFTPTESLVVDSPLAQAVAIMKLEHSCPHCNPCGAAACLGPIPLPPRGPPPPNPLRPMRFDAFLDVLRGAEANMPKPAGLVELPRARVQLGGQR